MQQPGGPAPASVLNIAAWAQEALALLTDVPGVHRVGLALAEGGGRRLRFTASDRDGSRGPMWCHIDAYDDVPLTTVVRTGEPVVGALDSLAAGYPGFVERQHGTATVSLAAEPLVAASQTLGGFVLFFDRPQSFDDAQQRELMSLGAKLGASLRRAQRGEERPKVLPSDDPAPGALVAVHEVAPDPAAVRLARRFLRQTLDDWGVDDETTDTAVLCLSELVTNAVIHAHGGCVVQVVLEQDVVTTTVRDGGTRDTASAETGDDPLQVHGRGLELVEALASRWGSEVDSVGTSVWFVLDLFADP